MKNPKYKLVGADKKPDEAAVCAFYLLPEGCRNGANCKFVHTTSANNSDNSKNVHVDSGSVVSSESEEPRSPKKRSADTRNSRNSRNFTSKVDQDRNYDNSNNERPNKKSKSSMEEALLNFNTLSSTKSKKTKMPKTEALSNSDSPHRQERNDDKQSHQRESAARHQSPVVPVQSSYTSMDTKSNHRESSAHSKSKYSRKNDESDKIQSKLNLPVASFSAMAEPDSRSHQKSDHKRNTARVTYDSESDNASLDHASSRRAAKHHVIDYEPQVNTMSRDRSTVKSPKAKKSKSSSAVMSWDADNTPLYAKLNLPVASFQIHGNKNAASSDESSQGKDSNSDSEENIEESDQDQVMTALPVLTSPGAKVWEAAIMECRKHPRFEEVINYKGTKLRFEEQGICAFSGWIKAKPYRPEYDSYPQSIAIDCEMCVTEDPVTRKRDHMSLCRMSVVNALTEEVLLDTLVKPPWPVVDYVTRINGIKKEDIENVQFTLRHAQAFLMELCNEQTVIIGHSIRSDLEAMHMEHYMIADSVLLYQDKEKSGNYVSLKDVVKSISGRDMPETHDSVNDAREALRCVKHFQDCNGKVDLVRRSLSARELHNNRLFLHRVPLDWHIIDVQNMFLKHANVLPYHINPIELSDKYGRTHAVFKSSDHANLAFKCFGGNISEDILGHQQKRYVLREGGHLWIRRNGIDRFARRTGTPGQRRPRKSV